MTSPGYVYIFHGIGTPYIKIGQTSNFPQRLDTVEHGVPFHMEALSIALVFDMDVEEDRLLVQYQPYATRGEWSALPEEWLAKWPIGPMDASAPKVQREEVSLMIRIMALIGQYQYTGVDIKARISGTSKSRIDDSLRYMVEHQYLFLSEMALAPRKMGYRNWLTEKFIKDFPSSAVASILTPKSLLLLLRVVGITLSVAPHGGNPNVLHIGGRSHMTETIRQEIARNKEALIAIIQSESHSKNP